MTAPELDITHRVEFAAAHRIHNQELSDEENRRLFGVCNNIHGHNYALEVTVRGPVQAQTGMVMNLVDLQEILEREIVSKVDHMNLTTDVAFMSGRVVTAETLAVAFWNCLASPIEERSSGRLISLKLYESAVNFVEYRGPKA